MQGEHSLLHVWRRRVMPPHTPTPVYTHKCIHTVLVNILQYVNEYTYPTNLLCLGGEGRGRRGRGKRGKGGGGGAQEGEGRSMGRGRGGGRGDRGIKESYSAVMWSTSRKLQLLDTCRGARCFDCYRRCHTPRCDGPGESLAAVNG